MQFFRRCAWTFLLGLVCGMVLSGVLLTTLQGGSPHQVAYRGAGSLPNGAASTDRAAVTAAATTRSGMFDGDACTVAEEQMTQSEALVDSSAGLDAHTFAAWGTAAAALRQQLSMKYSSNSFRDLQYAQLPSHCRQETLASQLCKDASKAWSYYNVSVLPRMHKHFNPVWIKYMNELFSNEMRDCYSFKYYARLGWKPDFFNWGKPTALQTRLRMLKDGPGWYTSKRSILWTPYGMPQKLTLGGGWTLSEEASTGKENMMVSAKNIDSAFYIMTLHAATNLTASSFDFVLDFGGGTSIQAQIFSKFGFTGKYVIFDLLPVSLMQRYFLRLAGFSAMRVPDEAEAQPGAAKKLTEYTANGKNNAVVQLISDLTRLRQVIPKQGVRLFFATYSLSESAMALREEFTAVVDLADFDVFYIWFAYHAESRWGDNMKYFKGFLKSLGDVSYCFWKGNQAFSAGSYGIVAMRKRLGRVQCHLFAEHSL